ncbi:Multidrug resistance protein stp [Corynebacterium occultum]|uniref:Multidrug resistance protein stp n=1 Tax=Corynebacterium occultum TaxID=2675219 RepID=A0A6B8W762_9CORY|nr:DHA2 family efflux MFS transporter permease subunit [Corynebacterium occultum]QGU07145.1 Multidrug resistance protein stp [Corynebacterium occultum]
MSQPNPNSLVLPAPQAWRALIALCIGFFMILLDQTIVAVATPAFQVELGASMNQIVWVTSIYLLCVLVPMLFTGRLGDRFGQRNLYRVGMIIFILSSLVCGLAPNIETLIAARAVQGLGAAILTPQTMSVINRVFAREKRGAALGVWGAVGGVAGVVAPTLGGFIVESVGWQWIFLINLPIGVLSLVLVSLWVPDMPRQVRRIDTPSVIASLAGMGALVFGIQQGPELGWPWWVWVLLIFGGVVMFGFIRLQRSAVRRGSDPLLPLEIFRNHNFSHGAFSIATMGFTVSSMMLPIMFFLQNGRGLNALQAGLMMLPMAALSIVISPLAGPLADRLHPRILSMIGFAAMALALLSASAVMRLDVALWWFLLPVLVMGVGQSLIWAPNSATSMRTMDPRHMGAASGVYNTARQVGAVAGAAAVGAAMQTGLDQLEVNVVMANAILLPSIALIAGFIAVSRFRAETLDDGAASPA